MTFDVIGRDSRSNKPWVISLDVLATGISQGKQLFRGRPALLSRLLPGFEKLVEGGAKSSASREMYQLYYFWRFLDYMEKLSRELPDLDSTAIDDLEWDQISGAWRQFLDWLRTQKLSPRMRYYINQTMCAVWRNSFDLAVGSGQAPEGAIDVFVYFRNDARASYRQEAMDFDDAKAAFKALSGAWREITRRIDRARALAQAGENPMVGSGGSNRWNGGKWPILANRLWAAMKYLPARVDMDSSVHAKLNSGFVTYPLPGDWRIHGVDREEGGANAYLSCLYLTRSEMAIAFAMVSMRTGLNPDAIARMRVDKWYRPDLMRPTERVIVYGPKRVGNYNLTAASSLNRLTDPYQVMRRVIEIQAPLRARMVADGTTSNNTDLVEMSRLIWVFPDYNGQMTNFLPGDNKNAETNSAQRLLADFFVKRNVRQKNGKHMQYKFTDGRDVWGLFVYHKSGFNHVLAAQALGHSTLTALLHYLEKRVTMIEDRKRLIDLQGRVLSNLKRGHYDPRSHRDRNPAAIEMASTGLLCTDSLHPDPEADPGNPGGKPCRSQGCWTCGRWYAVKESIPYLLRIVLDLEEMRDSRPVAVWETSDYPNMHAIYSHILGRFDAALVAAERAKAIKMPPIIKPRQFVGRAI